MQTADMKSIASVATAEHVTASGSEDGPPVDTLSVLARLSGLAQTSGIIQNAGTTILLGSAQSFNYQNVNQGTRQMPFPYTTVYPRQLRVAAAGGVLQNSTRRRTPIYVTQASYRGMRMKSQSAIFTSGADIRERRGYIAVGATSINGFLFQDIVSVGEAQPIDSGTGDSLQALFLKLHLFLQVLRHQSIATVLPTTGLFQKFDGWTQFAGGALPVGVNNSPVFGEDNGVNAGAVQNPYGATAGSFWIHNSTATVPSERKANIRYFPLSIALLFQSTYSSWAFAMYLFMFMTWPHAFRTISPQTRDTAGANLLAQLYSFFAEDVVVPGDDTIDIVMPSQSDAAQLNTIIGAQARPVYPIKWGPVDYSALGGHAPGTEVDVAVLGDIDAGQPVQATALVPFILSHLDPASPETSPVTVAQFITAWAKFTGAWNDNNWAAEVAQILSWRMSPPLFQLPGANHSDIQAIEQSFLPTLPHGYFQPSNGINYPQQLASLMDLLIPGHNALTLGQMCIGAAVWKVDGVEDKMTCFGSDPYALARSAAFPLVHTAAVNTLYRGIGISCYHWRNLFTVVGEAMEKVRDEYSQFWLASVNRDSSDPLDPIMVLRENVWARNFNAVTGFGVRRDSCGGSFYSYWNRNNLSQAFDCELGGFIGTFVPQYLSDYWQHIASARVPLAQQSWPSPNNQIAGLPNGDATNILQPTTGNVSVFTKRQKQIVGTEQVPIVDDVEVYNSKLIYHDFRGTQNAGGYIGLFNGTAYAGFGSPIPTAGAIWSDLYPRTFEATAVPNPMFGVVATTNSSWMPGMDEVGQNLYLFVTNVNKNFYNNMQNQNQFVFLEALIYPQTRMKSQAPSGGGKNEVPSAYALVRKTKNQMASSSSSKTVKKQETMEAKEAEKTTVTISVPST
jgi:hypothetical protein